MAKLPIGDPAGCRILIAMPVSDERSRIEAWLRGWGHSVETVESGTEMLETWAAAAPETILLLDPALPGLPGPLLVHRVESASIQRRCWTIVITDIVGDAGKDKALPLRAAGADDVLARPVEEFDLRVRIHTALRVRKLHVERVESIEAAHFRATHDSLTGLWNRESLLTRLFQETDRTQRLGSPLAFLLLDLDRFSEVNREHGYDGGDNVLRQLASRFRRYLRSYDLCGRCGEDEFLIAMPGGSNDDARSMAGRVQECIRERPFDILKASVKITASMGIAQSEGRSPLTVLREAESALDSAKRGGGDGIRFFSSTRAIGAAASGTISRRELESSGPRSVLV